MPPWLPLLTLVLASPAWSQPRTSVEVCVPSSREDRAWADRPRAEGGTDPWRRLRAGLTREGPLEPVDVDALLAYLPWSDPPPPPEQALAVTASVAPHPVHADRSLVRVAWRATQASDAPRAPLSIVALVDVSGSMVSTFGGGFPPLHDAEVDFAAGSDPSFRYPTTPRMTLAKRALWALVQQLGPEDRFALVAFGNGVHVLIPPSPGDPDPPLARGIAQLRAGERHRYGDPIDAAEALMSQMTRPCADHRYLVLSDGGAALGPRGLEATAARIAQTARAGTTWSGITLGRGLQPAERLEGVAWLGHGHHGYADSPHEAERVLQAMLHTPRVVGRDLRLQVDLGGATARPLHPGARLAVTVDEVWSSEHHSMLFEVDAPATSLSPTITWELGSPAPGEWTQGGQVGVPDPVAGREPSGHARLPASDPVAGREPSGHARLPASDLVAGREPSGHARLPDSNADLAIAWVVTELARAIHQRSPQTSWEQLFQVAHGAARRDHPVDVELLALVARAAGLSSAPSPLRAPP